MDEFCDALEAEATAPAARSTPASSWTLIGSALGAAARDGDARSSAIRAAGLRTAALTNNWADDPATGPTAASRDRRLVRRDRRVGGRRAAQARPAHLRARAARASTCSRRRTVFLDDLGINLKPAASMGMTTIKVVEPDRRARRARSRPRLRARRLMDLLWVRHGEPERIAPGSGVPADPGLTARGRDQAARLARLARARTDRRRRVEPAAPRARDRAPIAARGLELDVEIVDGSDRVRREVRLTTSRSRSCARRTTTAGTAMVEGRWEDVRRRAARRLPGAASSRALDAIIAAHPGRAGRRGLPRRRDQRLRRRVLGIGTPLVVRAGLHVDHAESPRRARACDRCVLNETAHLVATRTRRRSRHEHGQHRARRTGHDRHHRPARGPQRGRPCRRPRRSPTRSAPSTPTTTATSRSSPAPTARSAPAPTSRRSRPAAATASSPTATGRWARRRMLLDKPVIAAVEGHAVAGGLELALWCDLRVAARDAVFGVFCRRWGVPLIDGGTVRLPRLIGHSHALDLILTGRGVSGDEALRMGLANRLTEPGTALDGAVALAHELARAPPALPAQRPAARATSSGARRSTTRSPNEFDARRGDDRVGRDARGRDALRGRRGPPRGAGFLASRRRLRARLTDERDVAHDRRFQRAHRRRHHEHAGRHRHPGRDRRRRGRAHARAAVGSVVVVDTTSKPVGILTERDMIRLAAAGADTRRRAGVGVDDRRIPTRSAPTSTRRRGVREPVRARVPPHPGRRRRRSSSASCRCATSCASRRSSRPSAPRHEVPKGLEGVVVADTTIGDVRGLEGFYHYRQYNAVDLAQKRTLEDVWYLLFEGELPSLRQRDDVHRRGEAAAHDPGRGQGAASPGRSAGRPGRAAARHAAHDVLAARRSTSASGRRSTSAAPSCAPRRSRRARSCPRCSPRCTGSSTASSRSTRTRTSRTRPTTST